ncbi:transporter substrate-binding domain-containing protein [Labrys sp. KB_33_2]|uniref:transporter substrate-binding domain-containing protein n=1 Tax=Labrys sp. KB_33_2 TaxID=3237479 RepID=UPI003F937F44
MKIVNLSLLAGAAILAGLATAQADPVKISVSAEPIPPFFSLDGQGNWQGFLPDYAKAVCKQAKLDCVVVATAWDGIMPALLAKKIDVIWAGMSITPERQKQIAFTIPIYNTPVEFIGNKDDKFEFVPGGLKGKAVGVQTSTIHAQYVQKAYPDAEIRNYATLDAAMADLAAGRIELVLGDADSVGPFLEGKDGACCDSKGFPKDPLFEGGIGGGLRKEDTELKTKLDAGIKAVYASGEFKQIAGKYFKYDIGMPPK